MENINEAFWKASPEDMQRGYIYRQEEEDYRCLICGESFQDGKIYQRKGEFLDAKLTAKDHIVEKHQSVFHYLLNLSKRYTGLTDTQKEILEDLYLGRSDKEIVKNQGGKSPATIRNHRFKLREKEKQARVFVALMGLLDNPKKPKTPSEELVDIHRRATSVDDRYVITQGEQKKILQAYIKDGRVTTFPSKEKKKIVILQYIMEAFTANRQYEEKEVNEIIKEKFEDYVTVRRYLVQYGFLDRKRDGSSYWVKE